MEAVETANRSLTERLSTVASEAREFARAGLEKLDCSMGVAHRTLSGTMDTFGAGFRGALDTHAVQLGSLADELASTKRGLAKLLEDYARQPVPAQQPETNCYGAAPAPATPGPAAARLPSWTA